MHRYCLERILGANLNTLNKYDFLGVDDVLINKLLSYGYKHVPCDIRRRMSFDSGIYVD